MPFDDDTYFLKLAITGRDGPHKGMVNLSNSLSLEINATSAHDCIWW